MSLSLKSHISGRVVALFAGFLGGAIVSMYFGTQLHGGGLTPLLMFILVFGGAYAAQFVFSRAVHAECPRCGSDSAMPMARNPTLYVCEACGAESNALQAMMAEELARAAAVAPAQQAKTKSRMGVLFLIVGVGAIGIAGWLGAESIVLVRDGVSTDAKVVRVSVDSGGHEIHRTAFVEYKVGAQTRTLQRSWSSDSGSAWTWPSYHQGEQLRVIYLPSDPSRASIHSIAELFFGPIFLTLFGLVFGAVGGAMLFYRRQPDEAPDGTMVLGEQPKSQVQAPRVEAPGGTFLPRAIGTAVFLAGAGAFYYFTIARPELERQRIQAEAAARREAAREEAARRAALRAKAMAEAAARQASAAVPVQAKPGMSECQLLLLGQRNQWAAKFPQYAASFFNIKGPQGVDCKDCRAELAGKLQSWAGFEVPGRGFFQSSYKPGCVAFRQDIFATAAGAKCIVAFLGSGYTVDAACQLDGFPYTVTHLAPH